MAKASAASPSTSSRGKKAPRASAEASKASSSSEKLLDGHVAPSQALKAFKALESHRNKHKASVAEASKDSGKSQLPLDAEADDDVGGSRSEDTVYLNVAIKRLSPTKKSKPHQIPLPNPLHDPKTSSVCLIVKDPQRHYKDLLPTLGVKCVHRVVGVSKLKGKFAPYEARRQLLEDYDVFLCDDRVGALMPKLLGSKWQQSKKMPLSVNLVQTRHIKARLEKAVASSVYHSNRGSNISLAIGSIKRHTAEQLVENLGTVLPALMRKVPYDGWKNVQALEVKTGRSASLPVWNGELAKRWEGIKEQRDDSEDSESEEEEPVPKPSKAAKVAKADKAVEAPAAASPTATKKSKRSSASEADEASEPAKKTKKAKKAAA